MAAALARCRRHFFLPCTWALSSISHTQSFQLRPVAASTFVQYRRAFGGTSCKAQNTDDDPHALFKEQMQELKSEREDLFGFTPEDQAGWTNVQGHKHTDSFLEQVNAAREAAHKTVNELDDGDYDDDYHSNPMEDGDTVPYSFRKSAREDTEENPAPTLTHVSSDGSSVHMVDVGSKAVTHRIAVAESRMVFPPDTWNALCANPRPNNNEWIGPKGPILTTAKIAGIQAAKKTSDLIPLCHPLPLNSVNVEIRLDDDTCTAIIQCECKVEHKTGVEMEALTGASVAALTIYDMCKAMSHDILIESTRLIQKSGGKRIVNKRTTNDSSRPQQ